MYMYAGTFRLLEGGVTKATTLIFKFEIANEMQMVQHILDRRIWVVHGLTWRQQPSAETLKRAEVWRNGRR